MKQTKRMDIVVLFITLVLASGCLFISSSEGVLNTLENTYGLSFREYPSAYLIEKEEGTVTKERSLFYCRQL